MIYLTDVLIAKSFCTLEYFVNLFCVCYLTISDWMVYFTGKNDGSVKGVRYFKCRGRHGIFVRHEKLIMDKKRRSSTGMCYFIMG